MKRNRKAPLTTATQPQAHPTQSYTVTITRRGHGTGQEEQLTHKTFRLQDLPGLLQAIERTHAHGTALVQETRAPPRRPGCRRRRPAPCPVTLHASLMLAHSRQRHHIRKKL